MKNSNALAINVCNFGRFEAEKAAGKFVDTGRALPAGDNYLIWDFDIRRRNMSWMYDAKDEITDFGWIIEDVGTTKPISRREDFGLDKFWREDAFVYTVMPATEDAFYENCIDMDLDKVDELFDEFSRIGVRIRVSNIGDIVIETNQKLTLKARALFGRAFGWSDLIDYKEASDEEEMAWGVLRCYLEGFIVGYQHICKVNGTNINQDERLTKDMDIPQRAIWRLESQGINTLMQVKKKSEDGFAGCNLHAFDKTVIIKSLEYYDSIPKPYKNVPAPRNEVALDELDSLIGLEGVKNQVKRIRAFAKMKQDNSICASTGMSLNMVFKGNPGTCKTTVARVLAKILFELGILESSDIVEVGRSGLVGRYIGSTAVRVREIFEKASGKLLFIDEAYSLVEQDHDWYGQEAISTIIQEMENRRDKTVVIFAGYPEQMDDFLKSNPGLKSRVPFEISFNDYSASEMYAIAEHEACKHGFSISPDAKSQVMTLISSYGMAPDSGNGRFVRNLVENAIMNYSVRFYGDDASGEGKNDLILISDDFTYDGEVSSSKAREYRIGFDVA